MGDWKSPASLKAFYEKMVEEQSRVAPSCDWFEYKEEHVLEMKLRIANCLLGCPEHIEQGFQRLTDFLDSFTPEQREIVDKVFSVIIGLFKGSVTTIEISRILVGLKTAEGEHKMLIMKVRTREKKDSTTYFIDHLARRHANWNDFMRRNQLPHGYFVFPRNGQYFPEGKDKYVIDRQWLKKGREKAAKIMDYFMLVLGVGVGVVVIVGIFIPLTTPLVLTAISMASFAPLLWGGGRCAWGLHDRRSHGQSISDKESVPLWIGVAAATLGVAAGGAAAIGLTSGVLGIADDVAGVAVNALRVTPAASAFAANICAVTSVGDGRLPANQEIAAIIWSLFVTYNIVFTARDVHDLCAHSAADGGAPVEYLHELVRRLAVTRAVAALPLRAGEPLLRSLFGPVNKVATKALAREAMANAMAQLQKMMRHGDDDNDDVDAQLSISSKPHLALEGSPQKDLHDDNNNDSDEQLSISFEHRMALEPRPSEDQGYSDE